MKIVQRDPTLLHQIKIEVNSAGAIIVTCNCCHSRYRSMGPAPTVEAARLLYNDAANHDAPFDKTWENHG